MKALLILSIIIVSLVGSYAAYCNGKPGPIHTNTKPIWDGEPRLIREVKNGKLYVIGDPAWNNTMYLLHLYGSNMYEFGEAQGALPEWIPEWLQEDIANLGATAALDLEYLATRLYTNKAYYEEMRGLSDASGVSLGLLKRIHLIGELTKGACSAFGAWGDASFNGKTIQLRALDWDFDGPYRKFPSITVYHPSNPKKQGNAWANIGFIGWLGVLSGINEHQMAISEIGVSYPDDTFGKESRFGNPFTFVLRDILQFDQNLNQSISRLQNEHRTCDLILGVGDGKPDFATFRGFQYSKSVCNVMSDQTLLPQNSTWHPIIDNCAYWGMDWLCPNYDSRLAELLQLYHGQIDALNTVQNILPGLNSGNLQAVVYDLTEMNIYVAYGYKTDDNSFKLDAYDKSYVKLNMVQQFAETRNP